jgi:hypothetical protein
MRGLLRVSIIAPLMVVVGCGGSSHADKASGNHGVTKADLASLCQSAATTLHVGADRKLVSSAILTAGMIAQQEQHANAASDAAKWRKRPSGEKYAACGFEYKTPRESAPSGSPTQCPGGFQAEPAPVPDLGTILAVVDAAGHVTRLTTPPPPHDSAC